MVIGELTTLLLSATTNTKVLSCISYVASCGTATADVIIFGTRILPVFPDRNIPSAFSKLALKLMAPVVLLNWPDTVCTLPFLDTLYHQLRSVQQEAIVLFFLQWYFRCIDF